GLELNNSPAARIVNCDIGGNGSGGGRGIYIHGTAGSGNTAGFQQICNCQYGNNYQEDIYIVGFDTVGGGQSAVLNTIANCIFIGSANRPASTYADINLIDGVLNCITGCHFNADGSQSIAGVTCSETASGRSAPTAITGCSVNSGIVLSSDSTLASRNILSGNALWAGGFFRDLQTGLGANYNSGSAKLIFQPGGVASTMVRIEGVQAITRAATTSSTMPSLTLSWTDAGGVARTLTLVATSAGNATTVNTPFSTVITTNPGTGVTI